MIRAVIIYILLGVFMLIAISVGMYDEMENLIYEKSREIGISPAFITIVLALVIILFGPGRLLYVGIQAIIKSIVGK